MAKRTNRTRRRDRSRHKEMDWFGEDPWAEPKPLSFDDDGDERESWESDDWDWSDTEEGYWTDDDHDGWGEIRPRSRHA